jgi:(p)ppGpp synthase/HD superfamily hydrolase
MSSESVAHREYALTSPQLILQAVQARYDATSLARLRHAHETAVRLFDGWYRAQGTPFLCHLVRTASITMAHGRSVDTVLAALLHAVYDYGIFRDGQVGGSTGAHRQEIRDVVGAEAEQRIFAYAKLDFDDPDVLRATARDYAGLSAEEKDVVLAVLANELEDFLDLQMVFRQGNDFRKRIERIGDPMKELAHVAGCAGLAGELEEAFRRSLEASIPEAVRSERSGAYEHPDHLRLRKGVLHAWLAIGKQNILARIGPSNPVRALVWRFLQKLR